MTASDLLKQGQATTKYAKTSKPKPENARKSIQSLWRRLEQKPGEFLARLIFKNLFQQNPEMVRFFPMDTVEGAISKEMKEMVSQLGRAIHSRENINKIGLRHLAREVEAHHYIALWDAVTESLRDQLNSKELECLAEIGQEIIAEVVGDLYKARDQYRKIYEETGVSQENIDEALRIWKRVIYTHRMMIGQPYFKNLFRIYPELLSKFKQISQADENQVEQLLSQIGSSVVDGLMTVVLSLEEVEVLFYVCQQTALKLQKYEFTAGEYFFLKEALIMTIE